jgi:hypothetical protein
MDSRRDPRGRRGSISPVSLVVAAAVGVVGYVAGLATARSSAAPSASPAGTLIAIPPPPTPRTTRSASLAPSAMPTDAPRWAWHGTSFFPEGLEVEELWSLPGRVLGLAWCGDGHCVPMLDSGGRWQNAPLPPGVTAFRGGAVVGDRLWFLGYEERMQLREAKWRLIGSIGDENEAWTSRPPSDLDRSITPRLLGNLDGTWVTAYHGEGGNIEIGAPQYLRWSRDGIHWNPARIPSLRDVDPFDVAFNDVAATSELILVHANVTRSGDTNNALFVSDDGVDWREVSPPERVDWHASLACSETACVLTPFSWEDEEIEYPAPIAWVSTDGLSWTPSATVLADVSAGPGIAHVEPIDTGFVGIEGDRSNVAWLSSPDGSTWQRYEPLPRDLGVPIIDLAVSGDIVVALEQEPDVERQGAWVGSLQELRNAP